MNIPANLIERIEEVISYVGTSTSNYLAVKRQLINNFPNTDRSLFSVRHPCTKKHILNEFDLAVIWYWQERTGTSLKVSPEKLHDPQWEHKKKGWALNLFNRERKRQHETQPESSTTSPRVH